MRGADITFRRPSKGAHIAASPEDLFRDLPRTKDGPPFPWSHQADVLREYHASHLVTPDVAVELPTGAGKTLVGMLIAEWRRRANGERIAYLCPTVQLARQAATHARSYGVDPVVLVGSSKKWDDADVVRYERADAIAVATYSTVFNSNPHLSDAQVILLDDAHAGESFVAGAWSLQVERNNNARLYVDLLDILEEGLDPLFLSRMRQDDADPRRLWDCQIVSPFYVNKRVQDLDRLIRSSVRNTQHAFQYSMIQGQLDRALVYISWPEILIRPLIAPTFSHPAFADARQRVYMSATVGEGGELERAFGRPNIERIPLPPG